MNIARHKDIWSSKIVWWNSDRNCRSMILTGKEKFIWETTDWEKPNETRIHLSVYERWARINKIRKKKEKKKQ